MACSYDTQTVLEMLFDVNKDSGINSDRIRDDSNRDSVSCAYEGAITCSLFNVHKVR